MEFYFQIKGKTDSGWSWPPLISGKIEALNKKEARSILENEYGKDLPQRVTSEKLSTTEFLLHLDEIKEDDHLTKRLFEIKSCKQCYKPYKVIEKYIHTGAGGGSDYCSTECRNEHDDVEKMKQGAFRISQAELDNQKGGKPVIYKITNKFTGKSYIGKTYQLFTMRWYQHFFQPTDCKFHEEIKNTPLTDWMFEILEVVSIPADVTTMSQIDSLSVERERFYIEQFNTINEGYNSKL